MKRLLLQLVLLCSLTASAEHYIVFSVTGPVARLQKGKQLVDVKVRDTYTAADVLVIPETGILKLFDEANRKLYTFRRPGQGSIKELIATQKGAEQSLTAKYFTYILNSVKGKGVLQTQTAHTNNTTTIYRGEQDSLIIKKETTNP